MSSVLKIENLNVGFNSDDGIRQILNNISLKVPKKSKIGIIGESGSGKTQTVLSVLGLLSGSLEIMSGEIQFQDHWVLSTPGVDESEWKSQYKKQTTRLRGHEIAIIFQDAKASLVPYQTIQEQAVETWVALNGDGNRPEIMENVTSLLKEMKFDDPGRILKSYPNQLSGGESQRAYIMLALLGSPSLLIADEPTSSLDRSNADNLLILLREVCESKEIPLILISHDLEDVIEYTDYVYVFFNGHVVEEFSTSEHSRDTKGNIPSHPYSQFLLSMEDGALLKELKKNAEYMAFFENGAMETSGQSGDGCPYYSNCRLRKSLPAADQKRCRQEKPVLKVYSNSNRSACWYDKR